MRTEKWVRTFSITALLRTLAALASGQFAVVGLAGVFVLGAFINGAQPVGRTVAGNDHFSGLIVTFILGVLVGQGHLFTPVASAILMTMLLAWKTELQRLAGDLAPGEIRGAVLLGLIGRYGQIEWSRAVVDGSSVRAVFGGRGQAPTPRIERSWEANAI